MVFLFNKDKNRAKSFRDGTFQVLKHVLYIYRGRFSALIHLQSDYRGRGRSAAEYLSITFLAGYLFRVFFSADVSSHGPGHADFYCSIEVAS